ncbi:eukaryotic aspartyl protease [Necator americanus]|uniref:Eukaryotic aspartyl protease n=1 Tax=Necator americanus TaxID=51031 RepID=W2TAX6_NECAM|nr:eukaryotic aspartyl protease [Necator americanus]ETN78734.1 eukaryotic aspartyl protease [Necator americanus]
MREDLCHEFGQCYTDMKEQIRNQSDNIYSMKEMACRVFCPEISCCEQKKILNEEEYSCKGKHIFNSKKSNTYVPTEGSWSDAYGNGEAEGFYGNDTVRFGGIGTNQLIVPGAHFGQAELITGYFTEHPIDGVFGLGFPILCTEEVVTPFQRAYDLQLIDPVFTVFLKHANEIEEDKFGGMFTFGGVDEEHCEKAITYETLTEAAYWKFKMANISCGSFSAKNEWSATTHTGDLFISGPWRIISEMAKQYNAVYDEDMDIFVIDCNAQPRMEIGIGSHKYTIRSSNLIIKVKEDYCIFALRSHETGEKLNRGIRCLNSKNLQ